MLYSDLVLGVWLEADDGGGAGRGRDGEVLLHVVHLPGGGGGGGEPGPVLEEVAQDGGVARVVCRVPGHRHTPRAHLRHEDCRGRLRWL